MLLVYILGLLINVFSTVLQIGDSVLHLLPISNLLLKPGPNAVQLIGGNDYPLEIHGDGKLITDDGYILEMHRIPYSPKNHTHKGEIPILLLHGLMTSSADWILTGPDKGMAYKLADQGYDVWMGNARGNEYSRKHTFFNADRNAGQFYNFTFHEIGYYDLPVMIDYILNVTKKDNIHCIGHSQGSTSFLVLLSEKPEYNSKIRMLNLLAPVAYTKNMVLPIARLLAPSAKYLEEVFWDTLRIYEFPRKSIFLRAVTKVLCSKYSILYNVCPLFVFMMAGYDEKQYDKDLSTTLFANAPSGSSMKQYIHYIQLCNSGAFRQYDYFSTEKNLMHYGQSSPLDYNITNVVVPVGLHYGKNDYLSSPIDVTSLRNHLPNVVIDNLLEYEKMNHLDFLWGKDIQTMLYDKLLQNMTMY